MTDDVDKGHVRIEDEKKQSAHLGSLSRSACRTARPAAGRPSRRHVISTIADDDSDAAGAPVAGQILVSQYRQLVTQIAMQLAAHAAEVSWLPPSSPSSPPEGAMRCTILREVRDCEMWNKERVPCD